MFSWPIFSALSARSRNAIATSDFAFIPPAEAAMRVRQSMFLSGSKVAPNHLAARLRFLLVVLDPTIHQLTALFLDGDVGRHLRLADLPLLLLDGDLRVQLVFLDLPLQLDGRVAADKDRFVGFSQQFLARGLQGLGHLRGGLEREDRQGRYFDPRAVAASQDFNPSIMFCVNAEELDSAIQPANAPG